MISEHASAVLDVRLRPGQDAESVTRELAAVMAEPTLELTSILSFRAYPPPREAGRFGAAAVGGGARLPGPLPMP